MKASVLVPGTNVSLSTMVSIAQSAERLDVPGLYLGEAARSALVPLAVVASMTDRIEIGPYVINTHGRSPYLAGLAMLDLDEAAAGRLRMGIGSGNRVVNETLHGSRITDALTKLEDYYRILKGMAAAGRDIFDYEGAVHSVRQWKPQFDIYRPDVEIDVAAMYPKALEAVGGFAEGVAMGTLLSDDYVSTFVRPTVGKGAEMAGRDPASIRYRMAAFVALDEDRDAALEHARRVICEMFGSKPHPHYNALLRREGYGPVLDQVSPLMQKGEVTAAMAVVPQEMVQSLMICGTLSDCIESARRYEGVVNELLLVDADSFRYMAPSASAIEELSEDAFQGALTVAANLAKESTSRTG